MVSRDGANQLATLAASPSRAGMWFSRGATLVCAVAVLTEVTGCISHTSVSYRAICEDSRTHVRVADQQCVTGKPPFMWVYYRSGQTAPAIGSTSSGGIATPPAEDEGGVVRGGVPGGGSVVGGDEGSNGGGSKGGGGEGGGGEGGDGEGGGE